MKKEQEPPHPTKAVATSERRHATDAYLRRFGWVIFSRPKRGEAVWIRDGEKYPQEQALQITERERSTDHPR